ncbi:MAG TPA: histidine kinase, partial [Mycobacterium sp.]|nr:histidine kinase [Mycobacterium sp.]
WEPDVLEACERAARESISGERRVLTHGRTSAVVAQPLLAEGSDVVGVLVVVTTRSPAPGMLGAVGEVARYAASQIELAELDASRARLDRAEVLALRAQISPHFIYNALNTIASFVRTDPDRARELILEFADFTRYSFRAAGQYTTLAEELRNIDRYVNLERARFGAALTVKLQVAPEVLNVVVPFLALQPLVENAVRHGFAGQGGGSVEIIARDEGSDCVITVEDDGVGMDPDALRAGPGDVLADGTSTKESHSAHVGLTNVDHRLRAAFGNDYGLVVETAIGAGTKVVMRVPKFRSGIRASGGSFW